MPGLIANNIESLGGSIKPIKNIVAKVNSISDLLNIDTSKLDDKEQFHVLGFHEPNDGGGGIFYWDANEDKSNHNGGTIISPDAMFPSDWSDTNQQSVWFTSGGTGNGCWKRVIGDYVTPEMFGAKGDGVTDDTVAMQKASDIAFELLIKNVLFGAKLYNVSDTLLLYSGVNYTGIGVGYTIIKQEAIDKPVLASKNYYDTNISPTGRMRISGFKIYGNANNPNNHGLLIRDYYTYIKDVRVMNVGGDGIHLTHVNKNSTAVSSTLVENYIKDCTVFHASGYCYYLGDADNNKITDGFLINCIASSTNTSPAHLFIGSAAGWKIDGFHAYGSATPDSIVIQNSYHTKVDNIYIETFQDQGLLLSKTQIALDVNNVSIKCNSANTDGKAVVFGKSSAVSEASVNVSNIHIIQNEATSVYGIYNTSENLIVNIKNIVFGGSGKEYITKYYSPNLTNIKRLENVIVDGNLTETSNQIALQYQGLGLPYYAISGRISGNSAVSVDLPICKIKSYGKILGTVHIMASSYDNGAKRAEWLAHFMISAKDNSTNNWTVYITDIISPSGFSVNPTITATHTGNDEGYVTVEFTFADSDAVGKVALLYTPSE